MKWSWLIPARVDDMAIRSRSQIAAKSELNGIVEEPPRIPPNIARIIGNEKTAPSSRVIGNMLKHETIT